MSQALHRPRRPALSRILAEAVALPMRARPDPGVADLLARMPRGDGHAVLVLPSSLSGDWQTETIRQFLGNLGYRAFAWELGVNLGPTPKIIAQLPARLTALVEAHGPTSVVGFSMGGLFARWLGYAPALVRGVITVCSPFRAPTESLFLPIGIMADAWWGPDYRALAEEMARPLTQHATFIHTRDDGIVAWESCRDTDRPDDNIETTGPHVTIAQNLDIFRIIAERLALVV